MSKASSRGWGCFMVSKPSSSSHGRSITESEFLLPQTFQAFPAEYKAPGIGTYELKVHCSSPHLDDLVDEPPRRLPHGLQLPAHRLNSAQSSKACQQQPTHKARFSRHNRNLQTRCDVMSTGQLITLMVWRVRCPWHITPPNFTLTAWRVHSPTKLAYVTS